MKHNHSSMYVCGTLGSTSYCYSISQSCMYPKYVFQFLFKFPDVFSTRSKKGIHGSNTMARISAMWLFAGVAAFTNAVAYRRGFVTKFGQILELRRILP